MRLQAYIVENGGSAPDRYPKVEYVSTECNPLPAENKFEASSIITSIGNEYCHDKHFAPALTNFGWKFSTLNIPALCKVIGMGNIVFGRAR
ncbi:MAG: hypothetical protein ACYDDO_00455 [Acidiferrobacterales bacterium]